MRKQCFLLSLHALLALGFPCLKAGSEIILEDFEREHFAPWKIEGEAFGKAPTAGAKDGQNYPIAGMEGRRLANSFTAKGGDVAKGKLISPEFKIERNYIVFKIAGGEMPGALAARLVVDGNVVRTQTPYRTRELLPAGWDVSEFKGKTAHIEIEDRARGNNWDEFIMVDDIRQSDTPAVVDWEKTLTLSGNFLNVPINRLGIKSTMELIVDGKPVLRTPIMPADPETAKAWASIPVAQYKGKNAAFKISNLPFALAEKPMAQFSQTLPQSENLYDERHRPQFHMSPQRGWGNDPNGMVYADGKWHLYFQHDPYSLNGLNKYWGHAVSEDLVHWKELPTAIYAYVQAQGKVYSGSAIADVKNRSGYGKDGKAPLIALFTDTGFGEALAYSNDGGETFSYIDENPVYKHRGRDPKVIWYPAEEARTQEKGHWVMAVFADTPDKKRVIDILTSENLRDWTKTDTVENYFECPELQQLKVFDAQGNPTGKTRWVIWGADGEYQTGTFDGRDFVPDTEKKLKTQYGAGYAGQCFNQAPDGRIVQIVWLRIGWNDMPFTQMYSVPLEMTLHETENGLRMRAYPVKELESLRGQRHDAKGSIDESHSLELPAQGQQFDIECAFDAPDSGRVVLQVGKERIVYDADKRTLNNAPLDPVGGQVKLRVLLDRPSLEIFGNGGTVWLAQRRIDSGKTANISLKAEGGAQTQAELNAYEMRSIWKNKK